MLASTETDTHSTIRQLIVELERSHRSEGQARQQAADVVAAKQLLAEATASTVAELEARLAGERARTSARLRAAEAARQSAAACHGVESAVLHGELCNMENDFYQRSLGPGINLFWVS